MLPLGSCLDVLLVGSLLLSSENPLSSCDRSHSSLLLCKDVELSLGTLRGHGLGLQRPLSLSWINHVSLPVIRYACPFRVFLRSLMTLVRGCMFMGENLVLSALIAVVSTLSKHERHPQFPSRTSPSSAWLHALFYFLYFIVYAITVVPIFLPLPRSTKPAPHSHNQSPPRCPCPWVLHVCSLPIPSCFFPPVPPPPTAVGLFCISMPLVQFLSLVYFVHEIRLGSEIL